MKPEQPHIEIKIEGRNFVEAQALSRLLAAIDSDYRRMYPNRRLVLSGIDQGSIWIFLLDMAAIAQPYLATAATFVEAGKTCLDFVKAIKSIIDHAGSGAVPTVHHDAPYEAVKKMAEVCKKTGASMKVKYVDGATTFEASITHPQAKKLPSQIRKMKPSKKNKAIRDVRKTESASDLAYQDPQMIVQRFVTLNDKGDTVMATQLMEAVVDILLNSGSVAAAVQIANALDQTGAYEIAIRIRQKINDRGSSSQTVLG